MHHPGPRISGQVQGCLGKFKDILPAQALVLNNTVVKWQPFDVMCTQEKTTEYRTNTAYWRKRLLTPSGSWKKFTHVHIAHGYSRHRRESWPFVMAWCASASSIKA